MKYGNKIMSEKSDKQNQIKIDCAKFSPNWTRLG